MSINHRSLTGVEDRQFRAEESAHIEVRFNLDACGSGRKLRPFLRSKFAVSQFEEELRAN